MQYLNGQWDPSDINGVGDVAMLTLDMGLDLASAGAGAKLGGAIVKNSGWFTSVSMSGQFVKNGKTLASGVRLSGNVEVTASRMGAKAVQVAEVGAANAVKRGAYSVYRGIDKAGVVRYIGITKRSLILRFSEHISSGTGRSFLRYEVIPNATNLSKEGARIWEQTLINQYGLQKNGGLLINKINSISPKYWWQYGIK